MKETKPNEYRQAVFSSSNSMERQDCGAEDLATARKEILQGGIALTKNSAHFKVLLHMWWQIKSGFAGWMFSAEDSAKFILYPEEKQTTINHALNRWAALALLDCKKHNPGEKGTVLYSLPARYANEKSFLKFFSEENLIKNGGVFKQISTLDTDPTLMPMTFQAILQEHSQKLEREKV